MATLSNYERVYEADNTSSALTINLGSWSALVLSRTGTLVIKAAGSYPITINCQSGETLDGESSQKMTAGADESITIVPGQTQGELFIT